jgi:glycosyltransferase involved in cell wall biosynthesis
MEPLSILHICNDFLWTKVHKNLYVNLDKLGLHQEIFTPIRKNSNKQNNHIDFTVQNSRIRYSSLLHNYHRVFFKAKIRKLFSDLEHSSRVAQFDIVHATTLFSDGALAYEIFKKYQIPYIVSVRNTDINAFLKYKPNLIFLAHQILANAKNLVFISQSNFDNFFRAPLIGRLGEGYRTKAVVINNGIDKYWLENINTEKRTATREILFIGRFDRNKNVLRLIKAFLQLNKVYGGLRLNLVGGTGVYAKKVAALVARHTGEIAYHGSIPETEQLLMLCRRCDIFAMASHYETFGLVYVEALTQGLPILFSKNQGIDATFAHNVGIAVDPGSASAIYRGLKHIIDHYDHFEVEKTSFQPFNWENIARRYFSMYRTISGA